MEAMRVDNLSKSFGGVQAIKDVSLRVELGERLVIIGPNGAGKTTLFNLLNGQLIGDKGKIYLFGEEITDIPLHRRAHMGMARSFQVTSLFPKLSILNNMFLALHGTLPSRLQMFRATASYKSLLNRAEKLLSLVDLWDRRNDPVQTVSYGEQRKLEIALCLASGPKLLLLDEPSAGLTSAEQLSVRKMIRSLPSDITTIVVDHNMDLVFGLADRIIVLHYGQIIAEGSPLEIQTHEKVREIYMGMKKEKSDIGSN